MVALVWWNWVTLFECVGLVTQKAIRPAAAPMNTFAVYYDRDDLNVSKCAQRNGEASIRFPSARVLVPERRLSGVRHLDPLLVGRCVCDVAVVPVPPLVGRGLRIALGRVFPDLLPAQRRDVEVLAGFVFSRDKKTSTGSLASCPTVAAR